MLLDPRPLGDVSCPEAGSLGSLSGRQVERAPKHMAVKPGLDPATLSLCPSSLCPSLPLQLPLPLSSLFQTTYVSSLPFFPPPASCGCVHSLTFHQSIELSSHFAAQPGSCLESLQDWRPLCSIWSSGEISGGASGRLLGGGFRHS